MIAPSLSFSTNSEDMHKARKDSGYLTTAVKEHFITLSYSKTVVGTFLERRERGNDTLARQTRLLSENRNLERQLNSCLHVPLLRRNRNEDDSDPLRLSTSEFDIKKTPPWRNTKSAVVTSCI